MEKIAALTLVAVHPRLVLQYRSCLSEQDTGLPEEEHASKCFQMLGFDIMVSLCTLLPITMASHA